MAFKRRVRFNPKRRIQPDSESVLVQWLQVDYGGNPEHKRPPGDKGLEKTAEYHQVSPLTVRYTLENRQL